MYLGKKISKNDVRLVINDLNVDHFFVESCASTVIPLLTKFYKIFLESGICPKEWKVSYIKPFYKKRDRFDVCNYRLISKYSIFIRIFIKR